MKEIVDLLLSDPPTSRQTLDLFRIGFRMKKGLIKVSKRREKIAEIAHILLKVGTEADKKAVLEHLVN